MAMPNDRDVEFLYEIGAFRFIERTWRQFLNADFANDAEHSFRVAWIALLLAKIEGVTDHEKILKMALVHDLPESRTGDVNYLSRQYTQRDEHQAMADIFGGTALESDFHAVWEEYDRRESIEAKIVKDADNLDVDFELREQASRGEGIRDVLQERRERVIYETQLYTNAARRLWKAVQETNPHSWHMRSRNRFMAGDWQLEATDEGKQ